MATHSCRGGADESRRASCVQRALWAFGRGSCRTGIFIGSPDQPPRNFLASPPTNPLIFPDPPPSIDLDGSDVLVGRGASVGRDVSGHAREAFRGRARNGRSIMRGWGGEDVSFLWRSTPLGTAQEDAERHSALVAPSAGQAGPVVEPWKVRMWDRQVRPLANTRLSVRYIARARPPERWLSWCARLIACPPGTGVSARRCTCSRLNWWRGQ